MSREFILYADESIRRGVKFSNFFGGVLIRSEHLKGVSLALEKAREEVGLNGEIKWTKVSTCYLSKYITMMDTFFDLVAEDRIKVRVMFTDNRFVAQELTREHREHEYFVLYYQFIKHAFGLKFSNYGRSPIVCRLYFDVLPDTREKAAMFKGYVGGLTKYFRNRIVIDREQIAEVKSHDHLPLQCLDVVLGAMQFRLNGKHREKAQGCSRRGHRTIAKEELYQHIRRRICGIRPKFNVGISTGKDNDVHNLWRHSYRHWLFVPNKRKQIDR